jgi:membrane protease YdiL (CAAX protease family)
MSIAHVLPQRQAAGPEPIQPMGLAESLVLFGVPALLLVPALYGLQPALISAGFAAPLSYAISLSLINIGLLLAAIWGYRHEGHPPTWSAFAARMRLERMGLREWKWTLAGLVVMGALSVLVSWLLLTTFGMLGFVPPDLGSTGGDQLLLIVVLIFNVAGEELWWRGYILPRQELAYGERTWLVNGVLWAFYHIFKWWVVPGMLITCLVIPFITQRLKNTTPGLIIHFVLNALGSIAIVVTLLMQLIQGGS